ncbi:MAG: inorganic diphosphatase [Saprospiraceae bacterium]
MENLWQTPAFSPAGNLNAVVEIPAGTNQKFELDRTTGAIRPDMRNGRQRMVEFLPYPVNYGFVPSTVMDNARGGDGDPLDVLVLAEAIPTGTVLEVRPIGLLLLQDGGELDHKVLSVPADPALQVVQVADWHDFQHRYSAIRHILELFFLYYDGLGVITIMGWSDEEAALTEVKKWQTKVL